jgi:hypothetical protein
MPESSGITKGDQFLCGMHACRAHGLIKSLDMSDGESSSTLPAGILVRRVMQCECGFTRNELAPGRRFEFQLQTGDITSLTALLMSTTLDRAPKLGSLHLLPPYRCHRRFRTICNASVACRI